MWSRDSFQEERDDLGSPRRRNFFDEADREYARRSGVEHREAFLSSRNRDGLSLRGNDEPDYTDGGGDVIPRRAYRVRLK